MRTEWDPHKAETNQKKHGVSFEEAKEIFEDPLHIALLDERFTYFEERWIAIGQTRSGHILVVAVQLYFDDQDEEVLRIISAREATPNERKQYENL
jgi:uncharacterized protein